MSQTKQISKTGNIRNLRKVIVFLRCSEPSHKNCLRMRDLLIKKADNITQAYTTNTTIKNEKYCVTARALVEDKQLEKFEDVLNHLSTNIPHKINVDKVLVQVTI